MLILSALSAAAGTNLRISTREEHYVDIDLKDPKVQASINKYIDQRIIGASRQLYDSLTKKIKTVEDKVLDVEKKAVKNRIAIIASKGTLDMAYPPLLLATTARTMGIESSIFFTLYGVNILKKNARLKVAPLANPAMPMPVPNIIGALPGMTAMASMMMTGMFKKQSVPPIKELLDMARESGVKLVCCQMTVDVLGVKQKNLIEGIEYGGLATFIEYGMGSTINLFV
jgi:peroxiredoxin family protein